MTSSESKELERLRLELAKATEQKECLQQEVDGLLTQGSTPSDHKATSASAQSYRELFENMSDGVALYEPIDDGRDFIFRDMNPAGCRSCQVNRQEIIGQSVKEVFPGVEEMGLFEIFQQVHRDGHPQRYDTTQYADERIAIWVENYVHRLATGEIVAIFADVTDQKRAQERLERSEAQYQDLYENAPDMYISVEAQTGFISQCNDTATKVTGFSRQELIGRHVSTLYHESSRERSRHAFEQFKSGGEVRDVELVLMTRDGSKVDISLSVTAITDSHGAITASRSVLRDITDRKRVAEERTLLVTAVEQASDGVVITDAKGTVLYVNTAFTLSEGTSMDELIGRSIEGIVCGSETECEEGFEEALREGRAWHGRIQKKYNGEPESILQVTASPIRDETEVTHFVIIRRDITREVKLEGQVRQTQRLESLGTLASGISHDFNNILTGIIGFLELARDEVPLEGSIRSSLDEASRGAERAKNLVRQILTFSRKDEIAVEPVDFAEVAGDALRFLRASIPTTTELVSHIATEHTTVLADATQLHQIVMNLCTNAFQSLTEEKGTITVHLDREVVDRRRAARTSGLEAGEYVVLKVWDTGVGIPQQRLERIFDPFYTTKEKKEGTGLGLAVVHGIAVAVGGAIDVESIVGEGTCFSVFIPRHLEASSRERTTTRESVSGSGEHVVVIDDEPSIVRLLTKHLTKRGFSVKGFTSPLKAMTALSESTRADVVICDVTMPQIDGLEVAKWIADELENVPVILMTGNRDRIDSHSLEPTVYCCLDKPLKIKTVTAVVQEALASRPKPSISFPSRAMR